MTTPATILRLVGDQAVVTPDGGTPERYLAADIAIALGTSLDKLPGLQVTARRDRHGRLYDWTKLTGDAR
ncbi:hypothetical protein [Streptomyces zaomyceticus]|uniref:hypothetical protein n=1 Tax=Streptomyces zaomyceticus TaxID=68286 RepID=UPI002E11A57B|nr:hypothetical protein OG237_06385 [Streptomyces zaomyceticus]